MIISPLELLPEIREGRILKNLGERDLENPEGIGFDLRLGDLSVIESGLGSLRVETRKTPPSKRINRGSSNFFHLLPETSYLATTCEAFDLPDGLAAQFFPRSTLFRSGIFFQSSILPPGYSGTMTFALQNLSKNPFEIEFQSRFAHVVFFEVSGAGNKYRGQWQGGRISQPIDERQV
jgi:deoxycytidine triphosphate deaminase